VEKRKGLEDQLQRLVDDATQAGWWGAWQDKQRQDNPGMEDVAGILESLINEMIRN
jgi:hypothetical protein